MRPLTATLAIAALALAQPAPPQAKPHPGTRNPAGDFPTGPKIGEKLPAITLPDQNGQPVTVSGRAAVVFYRSAVW